MDHAAYHGADAHAMHGGGSSTHYQATPSELALHANGQAAR